MFLVPFQQSLKSQAAFAELSGDFNPVHLDPVHARRTMFGQVVTHGVHNVLCSIEKYLKRHPFFIKHIAVTFRNPIFLSENIIIPSNISDNSVLLTLKCENIETTEIGCKQSISAPPNFFSAYL